MISALRFIVILWAAVRGNAFSQGRNGFHSSSILSRPRATGTNTNKDYTFQPTLRYPKTSLEMSLGIRGGSGIASAVMSKMSSSPLSLFNANLILLGLATASIKLADRMKMSNDNSSKSSPPKPAAIKSLQIRFLSVFWLLRCADWLQGPYFYEVYSSKIFGGVPASLAVVSRLFLTGFASTAIFGPLVGRASDNKGRKRGTIAFALLFSLGAASTKSSLLSVLLLGRVFSGIGTSLLFSAPESWLVGEAGNTQEGMKYLGETFGLVSGFSNIFSYIFQIFFSKSVKLMNTTPSFHDDYFKHC